uniref:Uncharacterized protein n=1 Tax=Riptortus pedestris TaxID=329032 RepID=R4WTV8_RIPPE|nr:unknown secreted protein [Riptortus pedestris]
MYLLTHTLLWSVLISIAFSDRILINDIVDRLLEGVSSTILQQGLDSINTEDLEHQWKYRWHFVKLKGSLKCTNGKVKKLSTIRRTGDSYFSAEGNKMAVSFSLGLQKLTIKYKCKATAKHLIKFHDSIKITVEHNSIRGEVSLTKDGDSCAASLERLETDRLDGVKIHTGGGPVNKIKDIILQAVYKHCKGSLLKNISSQMRKSASSRLGSQNWCKDIPHLNSTV